MNNTELKADDVIAYVRHLISEVGGLWGEDPFETIRLIDQILEKPWKWSVEINLWLATQPVDISAGHQRRPKRS